MSHESERVLGLLYAFDVPNFFSRSNGCSSVDSRLAVRGMAVIEERGGNSIQRLLCMLCFGSLLMQRVEWQEESCIWRSI